MKITNYRDKITAAESALKSVERLVTLYKMRAPSVIINEEVKIVSRRLTAITGNDSQEALRCAVNFIRALTKIDTKSTTAEQCKTVASQALKHVEEVAASTQGARN